MNFKLTTEPYIKFNPYDGYFILRLTNFESSPNLNRENFINSLNKFINENWYFIRMFHGRLGHFKFSRRRKRAYINGIKWKIFKRDNFTCQNCGSQEFLELDHIIPLAKGGKEKEENYQTLCQKCNRGKKDNLQ